MQEFIAKSISNIVEVYLLLTGKLGTKEMYEGLSMIMTEFESEIKPNALTLIKQLIN